MTLEQYVALLALVVSIFGGFPGIINIIQWSQQKPKYQFILDSISSGNYTNVDGKEMSFIIVAGAVYNGGEKPLFPKMFYLSAELADGSKMLFHTATIDEGFFEAFKGSNVIIKIDNPNGLVSAIKIDAKDAVFGTLLFFFDSNGINSSEVHSYEVCCIDFNNKTWKTVLNTADHVPYENVYSLKTGIKTKKK